MTREVRVSGIRRLLNLPDSTRRVQRDVDDEIGFHIESRVAELVASGMSPQRAREIAGHEFGDVTEARQEIARVDHRRLTRNRRQGSWDMFAQDVAYSFRSLRKQPTFSAIVVLVLALGIGANVTMFGIIDHLLLRAPEHVVDPGRVMTFGLTRTVDANARVQRVLSYPVYRDMRTATEAFTDVAAYATTNFATGRGRDARELNGSKVTANFFSLLDVRPALGRFFLPEENGDPIAPKVVVLSYGFWQQQFQGNRSAIGRTISIGDDAYTVVGVAPEGFAGVTPGPIDVWVPLTSDITAKEYDEWLTSRYSYWLLTIGRLKPGVTPERATAIATAVLRGGDARESGAPVARGEERHMRLVSVLPRDARARSADAKVAVLLGAVSVLVLLIACANVANLQLARGMARRREIAVRIALGIDRGRLIRQLIAETVLLALAAGVAAVMVTVWGGGILRRLILTSENTASQSLDFRLMAYTAIAAVVAGILSGLIPAVQSSSPALADTLRGGARAGGAARSATRGALLIAQAALTVVFLVGTVLFVKSLQRIQAVPLGLEPDRVLVVSAQTSGLRLTPADVASLYTRLEAAAREAPGVASVSLAVGLPFSTAWAEHVTVPGRDSLPTTADGGPYFNAVGADFFRTVGTRIVRGRGFTVAEQRGTTRVTVVNEILAKMWWPNEDPIGRCMRIGSDTNPCAEIVGVAENARRFNVIEQPAVQFFVPLEQRPSWATSRVLIVRPTGSAEQAVESLRRELQARVSDAPFLSVEPLEKSVSPQMRSWRLGATMFGAFGLLAVLVAALGLYSVLAYDVSRRIRELGIRVALGASRGDIGRMVVGRAVRVVVFGALIGFAIVIAAGSTVKPLLFETYAREQLAFAFAVVVLLTIALLAAVVPTRRAARVDPIIALRSE